MLTSEPSSGRYEGEPRRGGGNHEVSERYSDSDRLSEPDRVQEQDREETCQGEVFGGVQGQNGWVQGWHSISSGNSSAMALQELKTKQKKERGGQYAFNLQGSARSKAIIKGWCLETAALSSLHLRL